MTKRPPGAVVALAGLAAVVGLAAGCGPAAPASAPRSVPTDPPPTTAASAPPASTAASTTAPPAPPSTVTTTTSIRPARPPFAIDEITLPLVDTSRPTVSQGRTISPVRSLPTLVWFPARSGRWPLVVFAHGFQVGPTPYIPLLESWAAHGYVVAAPEFPLTDQAIAGANLDESDINNQPADVRFVTDRLVSAGSPVADRIDASRVAVAGHSDGAETSLAASTDPVPAGRPRYRAVLVLSGQPVDGAAGKNPPILVAQGDADTINPPSLGYSTWDEAAGPKYLLVMKGAGHLPAYELGSAWFPGVDTVTEAFLDAFVAGDAPVSGLARLVSGFAYLSLRSG